MQESVLFDLFRSVSLFLSLGDQQVIIFMVREKKCLPSSLVLGEKTKMQSSS